MNTIQSKEKSPLRDSIFFNNKLTTHQLKSIKGGNGDDNSGSAFCTGCGCAGCGMGGGGGGSW